MSRRGTYNGGSTIIRTWRRWPPRDEVAAKVVRVAPAPPKPPKIFEATVRQYLDECADAWLAGRPRPDVPELVKSRYQGRDLRDWTKGIFRTQLYMGSIRRAKERLHATAK